MKRTNPPYYKFEQIILMRIEELKEHILYNNTRDNRELIAINYNFIDAINLHRRMYS